MMKKSFLLFNLFPLMSALSLLSCGTNEQTDVFYKISYESSNLYTILNLPESAKVGEDIYFDVDSNSVFYTVGNVSVNDKIINKSQFGYLFEMPAEDVEIKVTMNIVDEYDDSKDHLSWGSTVNGLIPTYESYNQSTYRLDLVFNGISSSNWISSIETTIYSLNEDVIPSDAISFNKIKASTSSAIIGGYLLVDLTKIQVGETMIYLNLKPNNSSLGTLIKKFEVVEGSTTQTMDVTFEFENLSSYSSENIFFNFRNTSNQKLTTINLSDLTSNETTFTYEVNYEYNVSVGYATWNEEEGRYENMTSLHLNEWVGTNVGGAINTLKTTSSSEYLYLLKLTTENITVPFTIVD